MTRFDVTAETLQEAINLSTGLFAPLRGFLTEEDYRSVVDRMTLQSGHPWTIPITLDVPHDIFSELKKGETLTLVYGNKSLVALQIESLFEVDFPTDLDKIFKTSDPAHPGVKREKARSQFRVGGEIKLLDDSLLKDSLIPDEVRAIFRANGWSSIAGFQTRNPVHRGHEHLQRFAMETCDGVFINPVMGWKKAGDFSDQAVQAGYFAMIESYYPAEKIHFAGLRTPMRYAGPREAVFHALIRRNLGCTHFIIGRDHAGVGNYYGIYEAQELAKKVLPPSLIQLITLSEPYYCTRCEESVTSATCKHGADGKVEISGTLIRKMFQEGKSPDRRFMRSEVSRAILALKQDIFVREAP